MRAYVNLVGIWLRHQMLRGRLHGAATVVAAASVQGRLVELVCVLPDPRLPPPLAGEPYPEELFAYTHGEFVMLCVATSSQAVAFKKLLGRT